MSDIILVGGSKDGTVTGGEPGLNSVQNIVLNEDFTGPEYVDRYVSTGVFDRENREVYAHVGRYNAEESQSFWESLDKEEVARFVEAEKAERKAAEEAAAEADAKKAAEEAAKEEKPEEAKETEVASEESSKSGDDTDSEA